MISAANYFPIIYVTIPVSTSAAADEKKRENQNRAGWVFRSQAPA
jgi:hypothetical protein